MDRHLIRHHQPVHMVAKDHGDRHHPSMDHHQRVHYHLTMATDKVHRHRPLMVVANTDLVIVSVHHTEMDTDQTVVIKVDHLGQDRV